MMPGRSGWRMAGLVLTGWLSGCGLLPEAAPTSDGAGGTSW